MSNSWKRSAVALRLGLSGLIVFLSAACAATSTPAPPNTPGTEVTVRAGSKASGTAVPTSTPVPQASGTAVPTSTPVPQASGTAVPTPTPVRKDSGTAMPTSTPVPKASATAMPTPTPVPRAASERTKEIPAAVNGLADPSESIRLGDGTGGDDQALPIPDKGELKYPNLGSGLDGLVASVEAGQSTAEDAAADTPVHSGESVAVTVYLSGSVDGVVAFLEENGGDPRNVGEDYVEAYVPVTLLGPLSERPGVLRVRKSCRRSRAGRLAIHRTGSRRKRPAPGNDGRSWKGSRLRDRAYLSIQLRNRRHGGAHAP